MTAVYTLKDHYGEPSRLAHWIRGRGARETAESIIVAILLALLFRYFEAEAFVIPTGSMAPDLQGQHIDIACPRCGFEYLAGASEGDSIQPDKVKVTGCPMCRYQTELRPHADRRHRPFSGDRILVSKFAYDFASPERWDVIVFKYPNDGKMNFIKRLVGLPGEGLLIEYGDIYTYDLESESFDDRRIARKDPYKLNSMLILVDDTRYFSPVLEDAGWPDPWSEWSAAPDNSAWTRERPSPDESPIYSLAPSAESRWLGFRYSKPDPADWEMIDDGGLPRRMAEGNPAGGLVDDYYAYNDTLVTTTQIHPETGRVVQYDIRHPNGVHWVGDLGLCAWVTIGSDTGTLLLRTVEGGCAFVCSIDIASGNATFSAEGDDSVRFSETPSARTPVRGAGSYEIRFVNADDCLYLWIDGESIPIQGGDYSRHSPVVPVYRESGPSDSEPLAIGGLGAELQVTRLQVLRDIYYTSKNNSREQSARPEPPVEYVGYTQIGMIQDILRNPEKWNTQYAAALFASRARDESWVFRLGPHQLFPMGDNSPQSNDARIWDGLRYVDDSYLLGEALFIYWPHAKTGPLPFTPNFERMKFIH